MVSVVASPTLKLDLCCLLSKIKSFEPFVHTLFRVVASFYQGGRGSTLRGKWMISSQIGRSRWRIFRGRRLILPFRWKRGEKVGRISRRGFSILNSWQGMGWYTLPPGEPIHQPLLDKASPKIGIWGMPTPSSAIRGYLDMGS